VGDLVGYLRAAEPAALDAELPMICDSSGVLKWKGGAKVVVWSVAGDNVT